MSKQLFDHQLEGNVYVTIHNRSHIQEAEKIKSKMYMTRGSISQIWLRYFKKKHVEIGKHLCLNLPKLRRLHFGENRTSMDQKIYLIRTQIDYHITQITNKAILQ